VEQSGNRKSALVTIPHGDANNPLQWEDVLSKSARSRPALAAIRATKWEEPIPHSVLEALRFNS